MKKLLSTTLALCLAIGLAACGSGTPTAEPEQPAIPDLTGTWKQVNGGSEETYQTAVIQGDTMSIDWVMESEDTIALYWAGSFTPPTTPDEPYTWDSANDKTKTDTALLASTGDTKTFTYENGKIKYEVSMMEMTTTVELEKTSTDVPAEKTAVESEHYFKDNVLLGSDVKIEIKDHKVIPAGEGMNKYEDSPALAFWYDTTNISGAEIDASSAWMYSMSAVQDNDPNTVNDLETAFLADNEYSDASMQVIKKDGTVTAIFAYTLDDETTPVVLTATNGLLGEEIGTQEFKLK